MVTKKLNSFTFVVEKRNNSIRRATINYEIGITEDSELTKINSINIPLNNTQLTALISAVETLINNQENI